MLPRCVVYSAVFCLLAVLLPNTGVAQATAPQPNAGTSPCPNPEVMPAYPGGQAAMLRFVGENLRYPLQAKQQGIQGKVFVKFMVDSTGAVRHAEVKKGIGWGCDEEALRVVQALARFTPGMQDCKPISIYMALPINFSLSPVSRK